MSVREINKVIIISSALTGKVFLTIDYDDYIYLTSANDFVNDKINQLIHSDEGAIIKIGSKG